MKRIVLGININHADSSACIIADNKLLSAVEEERFNRIKHWAGFPKSSIEYCLSENGIKFSDVTDITINTNPLSNILPKISFFVKNYIQGKKKIEIWKRYQKKINIKKFIIKNFGHSNFKLHFIDHHLSHISSSLYPSGFKKCLAISIDGFGDFASMVVADCKNHKIKILAKVLFPNSIGVFYESMTQLAGFKKYGEEYKLMGLSAFGEPVYYNFLKKNFFKHNNFLELNLDLFNFHKKNFIYNFEGEPNQNQLFNEKVFELCKKENINHEEKNTFSRNIACSTQKIFEENLISIAKKYKGEHDNLVLSGGCALNSLANGKLDEKKIFKNIFVPYSPGDNGGSIGSALYFLYKNNFTSNVKNITSPYLGKRYSNQQVIDILNKKYKSQITYNEIDNYDDLNALVCSYLIDEKIIGWFQGKMEFGPRALGNRSIISSPIGPNIKNLINSKIKLRETFRPFAPSILEEKVSEWFYETPRSDYMSFVASIKEDKRKIIPAVTHVDGTGRLQTISKLQNEKFYNLIKKFETLTNVPILLNTSFNENEPIVMKPEEAIECFLRTKMDFLVINNIFVSKNNHI
tara:strand:- start:2149 stop:3879 length:1731 start_codon:yes stop_codon:yes gene_type:complete